MKLTTIRKIVLITFPLLILVCFLIYWIEPRFSLWQMGKSIIIKKQILPLARMFSSSSGKRYRVNDDKPRFVLAGPNLTLFPGVYWYKIAVAADCQGKDIGFIDVTRKTGGQGLGAKEIIVQMPGEKQEVAVRFEADLAFDYEFRLYANGSCPFEIKNAWLERERIGFREFALAIWQKAKNLVK